MNDKLLRFFIGLCGGLLISNIMLMKTFKEILDANDKRIEELRRNVEMWSKEIDELNRETDENIEKARKHQVAAEALLKEFDELEADS